MYRTLLIECAAHGILYVNGQFCGPMEREGQAFPVGNNAEVYIQMFCFGAASVPLTAKLVLKEGQIACLEPQESCYALLWPDGVIQLELRLPQADVLETSEETAVASGTLLRYLTLRLAGDSQAARLWLRPQDEASLPDLLAYHAAVPLRFAPLSAPDRYDDRAGLVRRIASNAAVVDAALSITSPAGQGHRLIEKVDILKT
ncbi:MAG: hypothetical protein IJB85_07230 [Clostridia bacterium]|nr:hypothetical protein [Clostridia bacterium]